MVLLFLLLLCLQRAHAQTAVVQIGNNDSNVLSNRFSYLEEATTTQTLDNILAPGAQARFKPLA